EDHRRAQGEEERREHVALLPPAQPSDQRVLGGPLRPAVPRRVVVRAVAVVLAVGLVVLLLVGDEVLQREAVVARDEVDALVRLSPVVLVEIAAPREAIAEVTGVAAVASPERAQRIPVLAIPLRPPDREV